MSRPEAASSEMSKATVTDHRVLAGVLEALSYPLRLELLEALRVPQLASQIRLQPHRHAKGENPARVVSKQAVQAHLDKLLAAGLVDTTEVLHEGHRAIRYQANARQFWAVSEGLRQLSHQYAGGEAVGDETGTVLAHPQAAPQEGPRLVVVHGAYESRSFPLRAGRRPSAGRAASGDATAQQPAAPRTPGNEGWVIGRSRKADISLDYDPFVSQQHAVVRSREGGSGAFTLEDLSKNGTTVNWRPVPRSTAHPLRPGDIVGVGRTLLAFAT